MGTEPVGRETRGRASAGGACTTQARRVQARPCKRAKGAPRKGGTASGVGGQVGPSAADLLGVREMRAAAGANAEDWGWSLRAHSLCYRITWAVGAPGMK